MRHETAAEETFLARMRAVDELVGDDEGAGRQFLAERAAGGNRNHIGHACALQRIDIGAVVDRGRRMDMAAAVAWQEHHVDAAASVPMSSASDGSPHGTFHASQRAFSSAGDLVDAAAADDAENGVGHVRRLHCREVQPQRSAEPRSKISA